MAEAKKSKTNNSNSLVMMVVVGVLVGWIVGFAIGASISEEEVSTENEEAIVEQAPAMSHASTEVDPANTPTVKITAIKDPKSGYNINLATTNFSFAPQNASTDHVEGEGHAHLYVNGEKIGRLYGNWVHVDDLKDGDNIITVTLNGNNHNDLQLNGKIISDTVVITVDGHDSHSHVEDGEDSHSH